MAETVAQTGVSKESGYLYYLGKDGDVWRTKMARGGKKTGGGPEPVAKAGVSREDNYLYYIDKQGNVASQGLTTFPLDLLIFFPSLSKI